VIVESESTKEAGPSTAIRKRPQEVIVESESTKEAGPSTAIGKRPEITGVDTHESPQGVIAEGQPTPGSSNLRPLEVTGYDQGRGKSIKYYVRWSDGTTPLHPKDYVEAVCPDLLAAHQKRSRALNTARWRANISQSRLYSPIIYDNKQ